MSKEEDMKALDDFNLAVIAIKKKITAHMDPSIKEVHAKHKKLTTLKKELITPFENVRISARKKRIAYQEEQERIAEEARKKEQARLDAIAEQKRKEEIEEAEAFGATDEAEAIAEAPVEAEAASVAPTAKVAGARKLWSAEVTDMKALLKGIIEGSLSEDLVSPNMSLLNSLAIKHKEEFNIPGVKAVSRLA